MKGKSFIVYGFAVIYKRTRINWIVQLAILKLDSDRCGMSCYQAIKVWPSQSIIKTIDHQFVEQKGVITFILTVQMRTGEERDDISQWPIESKFVYFRSNYDWKICLHYISTDAIKWIVYFDVASNRKFIPLRAMSQFILSNELY